LIHTQVVFAEGTTILISSGNNSQIDFSAKGDVSIGSINLADANLGLKITRESNIETKIVATPGLTPLFEAWGIKRDPWKGLKKVWKPRRSELEEMEFGKIDYSDYDVASWSRLFPFHPVVAH
jgi:hypothetical protein